MTLNQLSQVSTIVLALIVGTYTLQATQAILLPLVLAVMIYMLMIPSVDFMVRKWRFPRIWALCCLALVYITVFTLMILFSVSSIKNFSSEASLYKERLLESFQSVQVLLSGWGFDVQLNDLVSQIDRASLWDWGQLLTANLLNFVSYFGMISIYLIFLFLGRSRLSEWPSFALEIQKGISHYIWVKTMLSVLTASLVGVVLWILDVEMATLFVLFTFALNYIPSLGTIISIVLPLPVIWLQMGLGVPFWVFLGTAGVIQFYIGNIMEPKMLGRELNLHPVTVMFFLVFWGYVWGITGAFLSVPLTVIIKLILEKLPSGRPFAALLEGRMEWRQ